MGLPIAERLMKLHHGEISAWSDGVDRGATFTLRLPLAKSDEMGSERPTIVQPSHAPARLKVLIVEDNHDAADILSMMLRLYGYDTEVAYTGRMELDAPTDSVLM